MLATNFRSYSCSVLFFLFLINIFLWFMFFYSFHYSFHFISLTLSWRRPFLLGKSMDWFLYGNGLRHERVKGRVIHVKKALINDRLRVAKVSWKFRFPIFCNFAVIYLPVKFTIFLKSNLIFNSFCCPFC